jgi:cytochrome o ubiquinol oxidase subunit III
MLQKTISLQLPDPHSDHGGSNTVFGFWLYLMTDCIIFASLFAVFAVMGISSRAAPLARTSSRSRVWRRKPPSSC